MPVTVPNGVEITVTANNVVARGSRGEISTQLFDGITARADGGTVQLSCANLMNTTMKANFGMVRALLANAVTGVSQGFERVLELRGVGYRAQAQGGKLDLSLGFSHPVEYEMPEGIEVKVDKSRIIISGADKQRVGQVAAEIRAIRPPEPYKGKGVRYAEERVVMKEGKKA